METARQQEILERLEVIERMVQEARQSTHSWGWVPLLWGTGQIVAVLWSRHISNVIFAWLVMMCLCALLSALISWLNRRRGMTKTTVGRALSVIWIGAIVSMFILGFVGGFSGALSYRAILAILLCLKGAGNFASGSILRWPIQIGIGVLWWVAAAIAMVEPFTWVIWDFVTATVLGDVLFGLYLMVLERRGRAIA